MIQVKSHMPLLRIVCSLSVLARRMEADEIQEDAMEQMAIELSRLSRRLENLIDTNYGAFNGHPINCS